MSHFETFCQYTLLNPADIPRIVIYVVCLFSFFYQLAKQFLIFPIYLTLVFFLNILIELKSIIVVINTS